MPGSCAPRGRVPKGRLKYSRPIQPSLRDVEAAIVFPALKRRAILTKSPRDSTDCVTPTGSNLEMRPSARAGGVCPVRGDSERRERALVDFLRRAIGGNRDEQPATAVVINQSLRAAFVNLHPHAHGFGPVVITLKQFSPAMIAHAFDARR